MLRAIKNLQHVCKATALKVKTKHIKISRFKLSQQQGGYLIYQSQKNKSFVTVASLLTLGTIASMAIFYTQRTRENQIALGIVAASWFMYQRKIFKTLKSLKIHKTGTEVELRTYGFLGSDIFQRVTVLPINAFERVAKTTVSGGIVLEGGGFNRVKRFRYYFHQAAILDKVVFNHIADGNPVKFSDIL